MLGEQELASPRSGNGIGKARDQETSQPAREQGMELAGLGSGNGIGKGAARERGQLAYGMRTGLASQLATRERGQPARGMRTVPASMQISPP
jgi:hypothetical protein